jgi:hypothetical protein
VISQAGEDDPDRLRVGAVLLLEDPRGERLRIVAGKDRNSAL